MATDTLKGFKTVNAKETKLTHNKEVVGKPEGLKESQKTITKQSSKESDAPVTTGTHNLDIADAVDHPKDEVDPAMLELQATLSSQATEIAKLRQFLELLVSGEGNSFREAKLLTLFKKNRELKLTLDREHISTSKLKLQLKSLQQEIVRDRINDLADSTSKDLEIAVEHQALEVNRWKDKFKKVNEKLTKAQASQLYLNMEVVKLQQALKREVGEHIPLSKVLDEGGKWRGRNQQISLLKNKARELKAKLEHSELEEFHRIQIEAFELARNKEYEKLVTEFLSNRNELKNYQQKLDALQGRKIILENKIKKMKEKMALLVQKSENDDRLIIALRMEFESYKQVTAPFQGFEKVGGPIQLGLLRREHMLVAAFDQLKRESYQKELEIQAQAELIDYLRDIASSQFQQEHERLGTTLENDDDLQVVESSIF